MALHDIGDLAVKHDCGDAASSSPPRYSWLDDFIRPLLDRRRPQAPHKEFFSKKLEVGATDKAGRGIFASGDIYAGELLIVERACYEGTETEAATGLAQAWSRLEPHMQRRWSLLSTRSGDGAPAALRKRVPLPEWGLLGDDLAPEKPSDDWLSKSVAINGMHLAEFVDTPTGIRYIGNSRDGAAGGRDAVYPIGAMTNHSCLPNADKVPFSGWLVVRATRHIRPGSEVTFSYIDPRCPIRDRLLQLRDSWGFVCECERCLLELDVWPKALREHCDAKWEHMMTMHARQQVGLREMLGLVRELEHCTDKALEEYFVDLWKASMKKDFETSRHNRPWRRQFAAAADLTATQRSKLSCGATAGAGADHEGVVAFTRLRNMMLASYYLRPAIQAAFGLARAGRAHQNILDWSKFADIFKEVQPCSVLHVASLVQHAVSAAEGQHPEHEVSALLDVAALASENAYGDGRDLLKLLMQERLKWSDHAAKVLCRLLKVAYHGPLAADSAEAPEHNGSPTSGTKDAPQQCQESDSDDDDKAQAASDNDQAFVAAATFGGPRPGMVFKMGACGLGYYRDNPPSRPEVASPPPAGLVVNASRAAELGYHYLLPAPTAPVAAQASFESLSMPRSDCLDEMD